MCVCFGVVSKLPPPDTHITPLAADHTIHPLIPPLLSFVFFLLFSSQSHGQKKQTKKTTAGSEVSAHISNNVFCCWISLFRTSRRFETLPKTHWRLHRWHKVDTWIYEDGENRWVTSLNKHTVWQQISPVIQKSMKLNQRGPQTAGWHHCNKIEKYRANRS